MLRQRRLDPVLSAQACRPRGLTLKDITAIKRKSGDAGAASVAGTVDAAIICQPVLSKAAATDFGKVLVKPVAFAIRTDFVASSRRLICKNGHCREAEFGGES